MNGWTFNSLNELYDFSFKFVTELQEKNQPELASELDRALRGGTTSGEIPTYLALAFQKIEAQGYGNQQVSDALIDIRRAVKAPW